MVIHETLKNSIPEALRARDEVKLRTLRSLVTAMTNDVVNKKRKPDEFLTDEEAAAVLKRAANQRKDSIQQFEAAGRTDLAEPEKAELAIIESYLPSMMSREDIRLFALEMMKELDVSAKTAEDGGSPGAGLAALRGKFTGVLMKELRGRADGADVKAVVDSLIQ
ncbi:GatB/YqeY domain-containing protein [Candidatus Kaiserbacteria bacterium]|nr:GatB/YqeY domain-containing protein [Candidatus Kaiserbacteria bacterium]